MCEGEKCFKMHVCSLRENEHSMCSFSGCIAENINDDKKSKKKDTCVGLKFRMHDQGA